MFRDFVISWLISCLRENFYSQGATDERRTRIGRDPERRVYLDGRRQARAVGHQRPLFWRLGDLSPQGISRRSEPAVRLAGHRLVRAADSAVERRRDDVGTGRQ